MLHGSWSSINIVVMGHRLRFLTIAFALMVNAGIGPASAALDSSSSGWISPERVGPGGMVSISAVFNSETTLENVNVALEVRNAARERVFQQVIPAQTLTAGQENNYSTRWSVPSDLPPGLYTVQLGVFARDWSVSYIWNENAGEITVADSFEGMARAAYYVDCTQGNDTNTGVVPDLAWKSLQRASQASLQPGDFLRLRRGCAWTAPLTAAWNGSETRPITIEGYGSGALPLIQNGTFSQVSVLGSFLVFDGLNVRAEPALIDSTCKDNRVGYRLGFWFAPGSTQNTLKNSVIEDTGAGVDIGPGSSANTITHNEFLNNNMMWDVDPWVNDGGANGILIEGDSNDVSFNHISGSIVCSLRYPADGSAFELVGATSNRIHHNRIDGNWIFAEVSQSTSNDFAYNISTDGGFTNHADSLGTRLYNNVFYVPGGGVVSCLPCRPGGLSLVNNIFVADIAVYISADVPEHHNLFWRLGGGSPGMNVNRDSTSIVADPQFVDPANGDFHVLLSSPAINAGSGESVEAGWTADMGGTAVPLGPAVDIGNFETR